MMIKETENILITGITGFLGSNTIIPLLERKKGQNATDAIKDASLSLKRAYRNTDSSSSSSNFDYKYNVFALVRSKSANSKFLIDLQNRYKDRFTLIVGDFIDLVHDDNNSNNNDIDSNNNNNNNSVQQPIIDNISKILIDYNIDVVIHIAAMMEFYSNDNKVLYKTNVIGTENILKACVKVNSNSNNNNNNKSNNSKNKIKRFIYISTTETMGGKKPVTNIPRSELDDSYSHPNYYYGETKRIAEDYIRRYQLKYGLDCIILRTTGIYGKNDDFSLFEFIQAVSYGLLFFLPSFASGHVMYSHVDDIVQSILLSITKEKLATDDTELPHTYIIAPDQGLSYKETIVFLNEKLNRMKPRFQLPASIVFPVISCVGSVMYLFKKKKFLYQSETLKRMEEDRIFSNERAKRELGYRPQYTLKQGLNVTVEEYLENERIKSYPVSPLFLLTTILVLVIRFIFSWFS